jgi:5-methylcytosine-specific restriction endonuclease McrA
VELTKKQWKTIYREKIKMGTCYCYLCGRLIKDESDFNIDHMVPTSRGGQNDAGNWRPCHRACNGLKGALTYDEYQQWLRLETIRNGGKTK